MGRVGGGVDEPRIPMSWKLGGEEGSRRPLVKDDDSGPPAGSAVWAWKGGGEGSGMARVLCWRSGHRRGSPVAHQSWGKVWLHLRRLMPSLCHIIRDTKSLFWWLHLAGRFTRDSSRDETATLTAIFQMLVQGGGKVPRAVSDPGSRAADSAGAFNSSLLPIHIMISQFCCLSQTISLISRPACTQRIQQQH